MTLGGNGFIAAFVGGIAFRAATHDQLMEPTEFTETFGTFLSLLVWSIFGAVLVTTLFSHSFDWRPLIYAMLSLTVVRMAPVALSMIGAGLRPDSVAIMGWFGPRGLASVVFTLMALEDFQERRPSGGYADSSCHLDDPLECFATRLDGRTAVLLVCTPPGGGSTTTGRTGRCVRSAPAPPCSGEIRAIAVYNTLIN